MATVKEYLLQCHCEMHILLIICIQILTLASEQDFAFHFTAVMLLAGSPKTLCVSMLEISRMWS